MGFFKRFREAQRPRCAALVVLTGGSWLGGVTGLGGNLTDCRVMVRCDSDGEALGAITGESDGTLTEVGGKRS